MYRNIQPNFSAWSTGAVLCLRGYVCSALWARFRRKKAILFTSSGRKGRRVGTLWAGPPDSCCSYKTHAAFVQMTKQNMLPSQLMPSPSLVNRFCLSVQPMSIAIPPPLAAAAVKAKERHFLVDKDTCVRFGSAASALVFCSRGMPR